VIDSPSTAESASESRSRHGTSEVVRIAGLSHRYGDVTALDAIDLNVPAGRLAGLIGPDGVGKSTLLGLIAGARHIQGGALEALGGDMRARRFRRAVSPRIAYMPQGLGRNLYPALSVFDNVDFFGRLFRQPGPERRARIDELLAATGLSPFRERPAGKLSGGMKQKLALMCTLLHRPRILFLDEPTNGVDPVSRRDFWAILYQLLKDGITIFMTTAYLDEAERCNRVGLMHKGRLIRCETPEALKREARAQNLEGAFIQMIRQAEAVGPFQQPREARP
jgi:ribosome-dependent ATPase